MGGRSISLAVASKERGSWHIGCAVGEPRTGPSRAWREAGLLDLGREACAANVVGATGSSFIVATSSLRSADFAASLLRRPRRIGLVSLGVTFRGWALSATGELPATSCTGGRVRWRSV